MIRLCDLWNGLEATQLLQCSDAGGQPYAGRAARECYWVAVPSFSNQVGLKFSVWQGNSVSPAVVILQWLLIAVLFCHDPNTTHTLSSLTGCWKKQGSFPAAQHGTDKRLMHVWEALDYTCPCLFQLVWHFRLCKVQDWESKQKVFVSGSVCSPCVPAPESALICPSTGNWLLSWGTRALTAAWSDAAHSPLDICCILLIQKCYCALWNPACLYPGSVCKCCCTITAYSFTNTSKPLSLVFMYVSKCKLTLNMSLTPRRTVQISKQCVEQDFAGLLCICRWAQPCLPKPCSEQRARAAPGSNPRLGVLSRFLGSQQLLSVQRASLQGVSTEPSPAQACLLAVHTM